MRCRENFLDTHALHALTKRVPVDVVTIAQEIGGRGVVREGVHDLLGGPVGGWMLRHVEVDDAAAMVGEHDEDEEHPQAGRGHREEVERDEILDMVVEERPPGLRRLRVPPRASAGIQCARPR